MSYHKITIIGHAGSHPDHQVTPSGKEVTNFLLYVNERSGENGRTVRYKIKAWDRLSEVVLEHLLVGQLLLVEGIPSVDVWKDREGQPRAQMVVSAQMLRFLGSRPSTPESGSANQSQ